MFPGAGGGDSRGAVARDLAALSTGLRRQATDHQVQIPTPCPGGVSHQRATPIQMQYQAMQQSRQFANAKRSLAEMERHQFPSLHAAGLIRSIRQRGAATTAVPMIPTQQQQQQQRQFNYLSFQQPQLQPQQQQQQLSRQRYLLHQQEQQYLLQHQQNPLRPQQQEQQPQQNHNPVSSLSPVDLSSLSSSPLSAVTNPPANFAAANPTWSHHQPGNPGDDGLLRQKQLEFAKENGFFPCTASPSGCDDSSALTQSDCGNGDGNGSSSVTTLQDIEKCLFSDEEDDFLQLSAAADASGSEAAAVTHSDWSGTMEDLLAITSPPPPSSSASMSGVTVEHLINMTGHPPSCSSAVMSASASAACASASASLSASDSASASAATVPPPTSSLQQQQQQQNRAPLSPCTPSSSTSSTLSTAQCPSPAAPTVSKQQVLSEAAAAIADGNVDQAAAALAELKKGMMTAGNPSAEPPEQRLQVYLADALLSRINPASGERAAADLQSQYQGQSAVPELCSVEHFAAEHRLHEVGLFFRLGVGAANLAIIEATWGLPKIHIVDFDVGSGSQYSALLSSLSTRHRARAEAQKSAAAPAAPLSLPILKITAVADPNNPYSANTSCPDFLRIAEARIAQDAKRLGFGFEFRTVRLSPSVLTRAALGCTSEDPEAEPLVVNFAFALSKLADESVSPLNPRDELLRRVKSLSPRLVTVVEQEMNCNTASFLSRFREVSAYYATAFESLDIHSASKVPATERARAEAALGKKAANAVAAEGWRRVERCEVLGKWRARLGMAGFRPCPLSRAVVVDPLRKHISGLYSPVQQKNGDGNGSGSVSDSNAPVAGVNNFNVNMSMEEDGGGVVFGWKGRRLTAVSAWRC